MSSKCMNSLISPWVPATDSLKYGTEWKGHSALLKQYLCYDHLNMAFSRERFNCYAYLKD